MEEAARLLASLDKRYTSRVVVDLAAVNEGPREEHALRHLARDDVLVVLLDPSSESAGEEGHFAERRAEWLQSAVESNAAIIAVSVRAASVPLTGYLPPEWTDPGAIPEIRMNEKTWDADVTRLIEQIDVAFARHSRVEIARDELTSTAPDGEHALSADSPVPTGERAQPQLGEPAHRAPSEPAQRPSIEPEQLATAASVPGVSMPFAPPTRVDEPVDALENAAEADSAQPDSPPATADLAAAALQPAAAARARSPRRGWLPWAAASMLAVAGVAVLVAALSHGSSPQATRAPARGSAATQIGIEGSGLTAGQTIDVQGAISSIAVGRRNVWLSLPDRDELVRYDPRAGRPQTFATAGGPTAVSAGFKALWVGETASRSLAQFNGESGAEVAAAKLAGTPTAVSFALDDSSAWVADSSGAISHVALGGALVGTPAHTDPAAASIAWGEGGLWAATGAAGNGLLRVSLGPDHSETAFSVGPRPVAVALDQGVWTAHANGHLTRFDPRPGRLRVNTDVAVAPELDAIAATDPGPFVWATSKRTMELYRVTAASSPAVTGTVRFGSPPVALAVDAHDVWVATEDGKLTQIRFYERTPHR